MVRLQYSSLRCHPLFQETLFTGGTAPVCVTSAKVLGSCHVRCHVGATSCVDNVTVTDVTALSYRRACYQCAGVVTGVRMHIYERIWDDILIHPLTVICHAQSRHATNVSLINGIMCASILR